MLTIYYHIKNTGAQTKYVVIDRNDFIAIIEQLVLWLTLWGEHGNSHMESLNKHFQSTYYRKTKKIVGGKNGLNSPHSLISGLIYNLFFNKQDNLSISVLRSLEYISREIVTTEMALKELRIISNCKCVELKFVSVVDQPLRRSRESDKTNI